MRLDPASLAGMWIVQTQPRGDERGRLTRLFCADSFNAVRPKLRFVQVNHTLTKLCGTVRGLHWQRAPAADAKLVRCLRGRVFDVAVDLRPDSSTFGRWHAVELSQDNQRQVFIPEGCAHGFQTLSDDVEMLYQHTAAYSPELEAGLRHDDLQLAIAWPLPVALLSPRDQGHPSFSQQFPGGGA